MVKILYARHSIEYTELKSYFYGFSVWNEKNVALSWDETLMVFEELGIEPVPTLFTGVITEDIVKSLIKNLDLSKQEGFVIRQAGEIEYDSFNKKVAKWVRKGHVQTADHWMFQDVIPNQLKSA